MHDLRTEFSGDRQALLRRAWACFRTISEQQYGDTRKYYVDQIKKYIVIMACEDGYPYKINDDGIAEPLSLGKAAFEDLKLLNMTINKVADKYYEHLGRPMYLWQKDAFGLFKSIGGRDRQQMFADYPTIQGDKT